MRKYKVPRKLKKAARHIEQCQTPIESSSDGHAVYTSMLIGWKTVNGYPHTKWVTMAIRKIRKAHRITVAKMLEDSARAITNETSRVMLFPRGWTTGEE